MRYLKIFYFWIYMNKIPMFPISRKKKIPLHYSLFSKGQLHGPNFSPIEFINKPKVGYQRTWQKRLFNLLIISKYPRKFCETLQTKEKEKAAYIVGIAWTLPKKKKKKKDIAWICMSKNLIKVTLIYKVWYNYNGYNIFF